MALFFDKGIGRGKTYLLYGNINERFFGPDLAERDIEQYLVRLLKSRGYEHIVFYGQPGIKGKYCLDPVSARFFFSDNAGIPAPAAVNIEERQNPVTGNGSERHTAEEGTAGPAGSASESGGAGTAADGTGADDLRSMMRSSRRRHRGGYVPGDLSSGSQEPATNGTGQSAGARAAAEQSTESGRRIRYALRSQSPAEFFMEIGPKMLDPDSKMAVILYDLFVMPVFQIPSQLDAILTVWDNQRNNNLCLILAPETVSNTEDMGQMIRRVGLGPKFLVHSDNQNYSLNPVTCVNIPNPGADEIRNMLRRLMIVGIPKTGIGVLEKKLSIDYASLSRITDEILYCSSVYAGRNQGLQSGGSASEIYDRLCIYLAKKARGKKEVTLTEGEIAGIWNMESMDREGALSRLNRPGWENAYRGIREAVEIMENNYRQSNKEEEEIPDRTEAADRWSLDRMTITEAVKESRMKIPHFILLGNPGVGKSTIARLIGDLLHETGCLKKGHTVEVTREQLTSSYVAGIPKATRAQIDLAEEGVLFIDEAHALGNNDGGAERNSTGLEVIQTLNGAMTDPRRHFCVILAGYKDQMQDVYKLDPGFFGRFGGNEITIEDYSPELLEKILREHIAELGGSLDSSLTEEADGKPSPLQNLLRRIYLERDRRTFENARAMISLGDKVCGRAGGRPIRRKDFLDGSIREDWFEKDDMDDSYEKIRKELDEQFVGMEPFRELFEDIYLEIREKIQQGENPEDIELKPLLIVGNPGTGKTTVAKCLARLYHSFRMLGTPTPDFASASSLIGSYVGEAQERVLSHIRDAQSARGMFVIDEAHEFLSSTFGEGAIGACMEPTTDRDHPFMLVMNVYADREEKFKKSNSGIMSRFMTIRLEDYKPEELFEICRRLIVRNGYTMEDRAADRLLDLCRQTYFNREFDTGNGRWCNNVYKQINKSRRKRCNEHQIGHEEEAYRRIVETDIPLPATLTDADSMLPLFRDCRTRDEKLKYLDDIEERMERERVGAEPIKRILRRIIDTLRYNVLYPNRTVVLEPGHYFFKGNAGTGKTTGAEYMAGYLHALGLIESAGIRRLSATDLVGQYLGETGVKTRNQLMEGRHHVTLVDEAYALGDRNGHADSYKREALSEIVAFLDDKTYRRDTTMIFAGYNGDMDVLYTTNQGLKSRISEVEFPDFTDTECVAIFRSLAEENDLTIDAEAETLLEGTVRKLRAIPGFANGRTIRRFFEAVNGTVMNRSLREKYDPEDRRVVTILKEDIESTYASL